MACPYGASERQVHSPEEIADLVRGCLGSVRAVHGIVLDIRSVELANGSGGGVGGIGSARDLAQARNNLFAFQHHHQGAARAHERREALEEGLAAVHDVKSFRLFLRKIHQARRDDFKVIRFEDLNDVTHVPRRNRVGLYNCQSTLYCHMVPKSLKVKG